MSLFWTKKWTEYEEQVKEAYQMGFADGRLCPQGRVCEADGRPAIFHRWIEEDEAVLEFNGCMMRRDDTIARVQDFKEHRFISPGCTAKVLRVTLAMVEYEDGSVGKVEPEKLKFTDRRVAE